VPAASPSLEELQGWVGALDEQADQSTDVYTMIESRPARGAAADPDDPPIAGRWKAPVGSGFGVRSDPFTGRAALHTGLDFPADVGTPVHAAAGGVVLLTETHPQYGRLVEIDHGRGLVTRYAHTSKVVVHTGDIVKRGQIVAMVGTTGRSTGPHLHFEVLVDGVPQKPGQVPAYTAGGPEIAMKRTGSSRRRGAPAEPAADQ
jgi:murein DD-endopeptidase MepM/ murein hydrolase activator NlpD